MLKREKIVYSLFFIVTLALVSTVAFLYLNSQVSLEKERARGMSVEAWVVHRDIENLVGYFYHFYWQIQEYDYQFAQGAISNETRDALFGGTMNDFYHEYSLYGQTIEGDINSLAGSSYPEQSYAAYQSISDTLQYSLNQIDFAILARTDNDSHRLIGELYNVLGINQETQSSNLTALRGISWSFSEMYWYWQEQSGLLIGGSKPEPNILLGWALANATQLFQSLVDWHNNNPRLSQ